MALPDQFVTAVGEQFIFADHATDFIGGAAKTSLEQGSPADVQLDTTGLADAAIRESAKVNLGASRAAAYSFMAAFEMAATPTSGDVINLWWAPSPDAAAANGNVMQLDGVDGTGPSGIGTSAELLSLCQFIGSFICSNDTTSEGVQVGFVGTLAPTERYGILIVENQSGAAFHSDAVESHIAMTPILDKIID